MFARLRLLAQICTNFLDLQRIYAYIVRMDAQLKTCSKCGEVKPIDEFSKDSKSKDVKMSICKACNCKRASAWAKENPDRVKNQRKTLDPVKAKARQDKYRSSEKYKETASRYRKIYYLSHKEQILDKGRRWWGKNYAEKMPGYSATYAEKNRDRLKSERPEKYAKRKEKILSSLKKLRDSLDDKYVKQVIRTEINISQDDIPPEMIELKREQLLMHRLTEQLAQLIKEKQSGTK